jgi:uncharacterized repeat protein (TIGR03803 family)
MGVALAAGFFAAVPAHAASEAVTYSFQGNPDGFYPQAGLINVHGTLYGTTNGGGATGYGTVFSISPSGAETVLHSFAGGSDGADPNGSLISTGGTLYGTTQGGGGTGCFDGQGCGTVFAVTTAGVEKVVYAFQGGSDGTYPMDQLIYVKKTKTLYGTTYSGGSANLGTVFSVTTAGTEAMLYPFQGYSDGAYPMAGLANVSGTFYGTTSAGGTPDGGTVFSITPAGAEKIVYAFQGGNDGAGPQARLLNSGGAMFGTTVGGGSADSGTVFEVTSSGLERVVYFFQNGSDGANPESALIVADGGLLYGTTFTGGGSNCLQGTCGTVFSLNRATGVEKVVYVFGYQGSTDAANPTGALLKANGAIYGTSTMGGAYGYPFGNGTVFTILP